MKSCKKNIVVLGGGFGGVKCVLFLEKLIRQKKIFKQYKIFLVDQNARHLYTPALYEAACTLKNDARASTLKKAISIPFKKIVKNKHIEFIQDKVIGVDAKNKKILLKEAGEIDFKYAVMSLGGETNYFNIPGLEEESLPLKSLSDAIRIRNKIEKIFSLLKLKKIKIIVGGGGLTGVEFASELINYIKKLCKKYKRNKKTVKLTIVEAAPSILQSFPRNVQKIAKKRLKRIGVITKNNSPIIKTGEKAVFVEDGTKIKFQGLIWTGGVKSSQIVKKGDLETTREGSVRPNEYLQCKKGVYSIGDISSFISPGSEKSDPWTIPAAISQAKVAAKNIVNDILDRPKIKYRPKNYPFIIPMGGKWAIVHIGRFTIRGFWAWLLKQSIELHYLLSIVRPRLALKIWLRGLEIFAKND